MNERLETVWLAIRDHGAQTVDEIAARCPAEYAGRQIGPIIFTLQQRGWVRPVGRGVGRRYVNARLARSL